MPFMQVGQGFHVGGRSVLAWRPAAGVYPHRRPPGAATSRSCFAHGEDGAQWGRALVRSSADPEVESEESRWRSRG